MMAIRKRSMCYLQGNRNQECPQAETMNPSVLEPTLQAVKLISLDEA